MFKTTFIFLKRIIQILQRKLRPNIRKTHSFSSSKKNPHTPTINPPNQNHTNTQQHHEPKRDFPKFSQRENLPQPREENEIFLLRPRRRIVISFARNPRWAGSRSCHACALYAMYKWRSVYDFQGINVVAHVSEVKMCVGLWTSEAFRFGLSSAEIGRCWVFFLGFVNGCLFDVYFLVVLNVCFLFGVIWICCYVWFVMIVYVYLYRYIIGCMIYNIF